MIPLRELKAWLGIAEDDVSQDEILTGMLERARDYLEQQTGRYFGPAEDVTERLDGSGRPTVWLSDDPVPGQPIDVVEAGRALEFEADWYVRGRRLERVDGVWWPCYACIAVTYMRGYRTEEHPYAPPLPGDVQQAMLQLVGAEIRNKGRAGLKSETIGGYSYTLGEFGSGDQATAGNWVGSTIAAWRKVQV